MTSQPPHFEHRCVDCGMGHVSGFHPFCSTCNGMVDVEYDLDSVRLTKSPNPYLRFAGLLPLVEARLPDATFTPLIHAERLGREIGLDALYLKDETRLPTGTTKDRMAAIAIAYLHECGVRAFCASSTGNSSTALAHAIRAYPDMRLYLFTAADFVPRVQQADHDQVRHFGLRDASFVEAAAFAGRYAAQHGHVAESGFFNPGRREGLKLAFLEATEQAPRAIDWYVQAVSSAMGVYGAYKGARELLAMGRIAHAPHLLCVQQESCAPMVHAFADGAETIRTEHVVERPIGIAEAILRGDPSRAYPHIRRIVIDSGGTLRAVGEAEIREAQRRVKALEGVSICFSAAAAVAGLIALTRDGGVKRDALVVVNLTGSDRNGPLPARVEWLTRDAQGWSPAR